MTTPSVPTEPAPIPTQIDVSLHLHVLNDETFTAADTTETRLYHTLPQPCELAPITQVLRLGGRRHLRLELRMSPGGDALPEGALHVQADLTEHHPAPVTASHHVLLPVGETQTLNLQLPGDPHPYALLTLTSTQTPSRADPPAALRAHARHLGWGTPDELRHVEVIAGGHQLRTPSGTLYHDGQRLCALHSAADHADRARGGTEGPLGMPGGHALTPHHWHVPFHTHDLLHGPAGTALLPRHVWTEWHSTRTQLGDPVSDTVNLVPQGLTVTACQRGTLVTDATTHARLPTRTRHVSAARVTRSLQRQLQPHLPPGLRAQVRPPAPGSPLRSAVTFTASGMAPVTLDLPFALRVTPTPDARRPARLSARQAGVIALPAGTPDVLAHQILSALEGTLGRPATLLDFPPGCGLIGARVTPEGALDLDFLSR